METTTFVLGLFGTLTGTTGVVLGIFNYLRDRASAVVTLGWDFVTLDSNNKPTGQPMGVVGIANNGRRPLYIKLVYLYVPKRSGHPAMILRNSLKGQKLGEGDEEFVIPISNQVHDYLENNLAAYWKHIRAVAQDNCGHQYKSKPPKKQPSWGEPKPSAEEAKAQN